MKVFKTNAIVRVSATALINTIELVSKIPRKGAMVLHTPSTDVYEMYLEIIVKFKQKLVLAIPSVFSMRMRICQKMSAVTC